MSEPKLERLARNLREWETTLEQQVAPLRPDHTEYVKHDPGCECDAYRVYDEALNVHLEDLRDLMLGEHEMLSDVVRIAGEALGYITDLVDLDQGARAEDVLLLNELRAMLGHKVSVPVVICRRCLQPMDLDGKLPDPHEQSLYHACCGTGGTVEPSKVES